MDPASREKNETRQLVQKWLEGRGGGVPFSKAPLIHATVFAMLLWTA